ncbi:ISSag6 transposase [Lactiplantibacillus plantarum]|nr:ISSag6 transposase [Lactiplantibacillus plantarum]
MDRGRRVTLEERIAIVKYTLDHANDYQEAAKHFNVSYPKCIPGYGNTGNGGWKDWLITAADQNETKHSVVHRSDGCHEA